VPEELTQKSPATGIGQGELLKRKTIAGKAIIRQVVTHVTACRFILCLLRGINRFPSFHLSSSFFRIANAYTQCRRISNPPERV